MTKFKFTGAMAALAAALFSFALISCNSEDDFPKEILFGVSEKSLAFIAEGESKAVAVTLNNGLGEWSADIAGGAEWLTLDYDGSASGTLTITATENTLYESRTATIALSTEGHSGITVEVTQDGLLMGGEPAHAADRTSWWRMNIKGHVKKMSGYYDYLGGGFYLQDLEFDMYGMLVKFSYTVPFMFTDEIHIEYDDEIHTRITKIYCPSNENHYPWQIVFHYGDHGKYITPYDTFTTIDNQTLYTYWRVWMPHLIKDLETIEIVEHAIQSYDGLKVIYSFSGNDGSSKMTIPYEGEIYEEDFHTMVYDGAYPKQLSYTFSIMGMPMPFTNDYDIDPANGYLRSFSWAYWMGAQSEAWASRTYNDDEYNSVASMHNFDFSIMELAACVYNEHMDLIEVGSHMSASYTYDSRGNWTKANVMSTIAGAAGYDCLIEYYD